MVASTTATDVLPAQVTTTRKIELADLTAAHRDAGHHRGRRLGPVTARHE
ncbi:hypothetical protein HGA13_21565 [Nocardia speluncae]|uniref:Uncharacterized protein n=1 Tax=Nocardia speluncae TaxID=419477 RepID=A0A846XK25_9NOCA|nr:hypothetical protein [Nocardia speluncae]NKY35639.1 hypothetical protein [Nocardia speluncae]